ncbi:MAG: hypothetical protein L6R35_002852, partial [Caloplaca aegaea]
LGRRGAVPGISGHHFNITFNEERRLILKGLSTRGIAVSYDSQAKDEVRSRFTWILDLERKEGEGEYDVEVHVPKAKSLAFKVKLARHDTCRAKYEENVTEFLEVSRDASARLERLCFDNIESTAPPSKTFSPRERPFYIPQQTLGSGSFGMVDMVVDTSTGLKYAQKRFFEPTWARAYERREWEKESWLEDIRKEVRIMRDYPYTLSGLEYLHARGVAHRDLKPENILVESRYPFSIMLADFGVANDKPDLRTCCGTRLYTAPEVYSGRPYTTAVDLWSVGVITLELLCGLPDTVRLGRREKGRLSSLSCRLVAHADDMLRIGSDKLLDFLRTGMLRVIAEERLSASGCLLRGYEVELFDPVAIESKSATPSQGTVSQANTDSDSGSSTILLGTLGGASEASDEDGQSRPRYCDAQHAIDLLGPPAAQTPSAQGSGVASVMPGIGRQADVEPPTDPIPGIDEIQPTYQPSYKRQRSPAAGSSGNPSGKGRIKRRLADVGRQMNSTSRTFPITSRYFEQKRGTVQSRAVYDAVFALLAELQMEGRADSEKDCYTCAPIEELCKCFAELEITEIRLSRNGPSYQTTVIAVSPGKEFVLARLTSSDCTASTADLAVHLLLLLRLCDSFKAKPPIAPANQSRVQADSRAQDNPLSWKTASSDSPWTASTAGKYGVTFPLGVVDNTLTD